MSTGGWHVLLIGAVYGAVATAVIYAVAAVHDRRRRVAERRARRAALAPVVWVRPRPGVPLDRAARRSRR